MVGQALANTYEGNSDCLLGLSANSMSVFISAVAYTNRVVNLLEWGGIDG